VLVPGNASKSRMYRMAAGIDKPAMPMGGKLKAEDIEAIRLWIDQGAVWDGADDGLSANRCTTRRQGR